MPARLAFTCCLCDAEGARSPRAVNPFDQESLVPHLPDNWCVLNIACPELVLDVSQQAVADELGLIARNPVYGIMAAQIRAMAQHFITTLVVCPACQVGPVFDVFQRRLKAAVDVAEAQHEVRQAGPSALPPWLRPVEDEDEHLAPWVDADQTEVWRADENTGDVESALVRLAGCDPRILATSGVSRLHAGRWVVHIHPVPRICRLLDR